MRRAAGSTTPTGGRPYLEANAKDHEKPAADLPRWFLLVLLALVCAAVVLFFNTIPASQTEAFDHDVEEAMNRLRLRSAERKKALRIPLQLVLTAKQESLAEMPKNVQANVRRTLEMSPSIRMRWLGDAACRKYMRDHFDSEMVAIFESEKRGSFRGDMCRAVVLAREGGFYLDLDVELHLPLEQLVDSDTTFVSAYTEDQAVLNAVLAATPGSPVMIEVLNQIRLWYRWAVPHADTETSSEFMGPVTMLRALRAVVERECRGHALHPKQVQWPCGPHRFRLYEEHSLNCWYPGTEEECPPKRASSQFDGVRFGIFTPERKLVAWPRFESCAEWGCSAGGWDEGPMGRANESALPKSVGENDDLLG